MTLLLIFTLCGDPFYVVGVDGDKAISAHFRTIEASAEGRMFLNALLGKSPEVRVIQSESTFGFVCT